MKGTFSCNLITKRNSREMLTVNVIVIKFNYFIVIIFRRRIVVVVPINFVGKFALFLLDKYFLCSHNINNDQMIMST